MAYVQKQLYPIPFTGGVDTKTDPKQVMAGNLITLQNGRFTNSGQINKRSGFELLPNNIAGSSDYINQAQAINSYNNELLLFDGINVYTYIAETQTWADKGIAGSVITNDTQIIRSSSSQQLNPDIAFLDNMEVYVWEDSRGDGYGSVRYTVLDTTTQAKIFADQPIGNGYAKPKAVSFNGDVFIFYTDQSNNIYYQTINPNGPNLISNQVNVISDGYILDDGETFSYDVCVIGNNMYVSYLANVSGTPSINFFNYPPSLIKSEVTQIAIDGYAFTSLSSQSVINVVGDSQNNQWVTWFNGLNTYTAAYTYPGLPLLGMTLVLANSIVNTITGIEWTTAGQILLTLEVYNPTPWNTLITSLVVQQDGNVDSLGNLRSVGLASKAYKINGNIYVNAAYQTPDNATYFTILMNLNPFTVVGKVDSSTGGGLRTNNMLSEVPLLRAGLVKFANLTKGSVISEAGTVFTLLGVNATSLDYDNANQFQAVTQNNNLQICGGILQVYDGISVVESNFNYPPENITTSVGNGSSGLGTGTYLYQITYEWMDAFGQIEQSTPSNGTSVVTTQNGQIVTLTIPTLRLTKKQTLQGRSNVTICVYRTPVNGTGDTLNEVTSILEPLINDPTTDTVQFMDQLSDIDASSNRFLYTIGGVLNNVSPPASSLITLYQNRVVLGGLEDPNLLWFSQNKQDYSNYNTTPTNFAAELTIGCDPLGGPITAIKNLNQNLVIFKKTNIFIVNGDGPNNTGGGTSYPNPQILTSDVGCSNQNSIAIIPTIPALNSTSGAGVGGLMFQSDKGIYLLDQGLNVTYVGAPVQNFNSLTITSTTLNPDQNLVIFTTLEGTSLIYDYYHNQWGTDTNQFAIDSLVFQDEFTFLTANGRVNQGNEEIFTDSGTPIFLSWTSPNLSFAQLNGYQRVFHVMLLGSYKGPHTLNIGVAYDYSPVYTQFGTITVEPATDYWGSDTTWGNETPWGGVYTPYEFRIDFAQQVCTSIRIQISDNQTSNYNEGYAISAMTFVVGLLPGSYKIPATSTVGTQ